MRVQYNEGQEVLKADLNKQQARHEQELYDRLAYELMQRGENKFLGTSFKCTRVDADTIQIAKGLGFQTDNTVSADEPTKRCIHAPANFTLDITAPDGALNRIDIVVVKANRVVTQTESRRYKATITSAITNQNFDISNDWTNDTQIVAGAPNAVPVAPATPAGYIRIASILVTAVTGIVAASDVLDERSIMDVVDLTLDRSYNSVQTFLKQVIFAEYARASVATPSADRVAVFVDENNLLVRKGEDGVVKALEKIGSYDAVIGSLPYCTHATLAAAVADASLGAGSRVLIVSDATLNATVTLNKANWLIEFAPGVSYTNGTAGTGLDIAAGGIRIRGGRFVGFTIAVNIGATFQYNFITECRFNTCTAEVEEDDATPVNFYATNITE